MEAIMWLVLYIRDQLWTEVREKDPNVVHPRTQASLDLIHILNEIISWAERSHYGDSGEMIPVASLERQAFSDVLVKAISQSIGFLENWDSMDVAEARRSVHAHAIALDTVATTALQPYYATNLFRLAQIPGTKLEGTRDGTGSGTVVQDDAGQR